MHEPSEKPYETKKKVIMPNIAKSLEIVPSKWQLLGCVLEDCSISKPNTSQPSPHQGYRGLDLKLQYNLENDSHVGFCDIYTHGSFEVFVMVNSVQLCVLLPNQQFTLPKKGFPTFIRSACMTKFKQSGNGLLIFYRPT